MKPTNRIGRREFLESTVLSAALLKAQDSSKALTAESRGVDQAGMLAPETGPQSGLARTMDEMRPHFFDPPVEFRTDPLWAWNDTMTVERIHEQLQQFKDQRLGGGFIHPRSGLITEYLGEEWFTLWNAALQEAKRLGLLCNIYDENSYPSGFSGGHVASIAPDATVQYVEPQLTDASGIKFYDGGWRTTPVAVFKVERDSAGKVLRAEKALEREYANLQGPVAIFSLRRSGGRAWCAGFSYVDLTHPDSGKLFIQTTFEAYKKHFGSEFGKATKWVFDDEALLGPDGPYEPGSLSLPLSFITLAEFRRRNGYGLEDELPSLFWDLGDWRKVRFDYWQILHDLWVEHYFRPIYEWCGQNGIEFTGHFIEEPWPAPWLSPDTASLYAFQHMPGIDLLVGDNVRTHGVDPHGVFVIRQLASVAQQLQRRTLCEAYGVSGWDSTFEHYKRVGDWLIVHGINFFSQHLILVSVRGARKRDNPQSFSDVAAWWPYYRLHADHTARLCYVMSQGAPANRVLVIEPTTSGFLWARRGGETPELTQLGKTFDEVNQFLADHQVDYDLGDEYMIEWFGDNSGQQFKIGKVAYDLVIWPREMVNVRRQTLPLVEKYLEGGGHILALGEPADLVDGRQSDAMRNLKNRFASQWTSVADLQSLLAEVRSRVPPRVNFDHELPPGIGHRMAILENGDRFHFFTNSGTKHVNTRVTVEGSSSEEWDTVTGKSQVAAFSSATSGKIALTLDLPPAGSRLFAVSMKAGGEKPVALPAARRGTVVPLTNWKITPSASNVLVLDYCDLKVAGQTFHDINTWQANWLIWRNHGFEQPVWEAVQFERRSIDLPAFPSDSGFEAAFHFRVGDARALQGARLALECPELYKVFVNDQPLDSSRGTRWLDPHLMSFPAGDLLKTGENTVRVMGAPFGTLMELENIYLLGDFSIQPESQGFSIQAPVDLRIGSWAKQGRPFYSDSVLYEASVVVSRHTRDLKVSLPAWAGSVAEVLLDGKRVQVIGWEPHVCEVAAEPGHHTVGIRIVSTPRNLFGPFHDPAKPRMIGWPGSWTKFPEHQPPGAEYDLVDYGLFEPFTVEALS